MTIMVKLGGIHSFDDPLFDEGRAFSRPISFFFLLLFFAAVAAAVVFSIGVLALPFLLDDDNR